MAWSIVFSVATLARAEALSKTGRLKPQRFEDKSVVLKKKKYVRIRRFTDIKPSKLLYRGIFNQ